MNENGTFKGSFDAKNKIKIKHTKKIKNILEYK